MNLGESCFIRGIEFHKFRIVKWFKKILLILVAAASVYAADEWHNYGNPYPIRSVLSFSNGVLLATEAGIRFRSVDFDTLYTSVNGLEASSYYALASSEAGVFAISEYGVIVHWNPDLRGWSILSRAYVSNGVRLVPDMVLNRKFILVLAFEDRIGFFDIVTRKSLLTITKIGKNSLSANMVQAMSIHNDTLYVATGSSVYSRYIDWDNVGSDLQLVNPDSWKLVMENENVQYMAWKGDSLKTFSTKGVRYWSEDGKFTSAALDSSVVMFDGKKLKDEVLYYDGKGRSRWIVQSQDKIYLVGEYFVYYYGANGVEDLMWYARFLAEGTYELRALPKGGVIVASTDGKFLYKNDKEWSIPSEVDAARQARNANERLTNRMKVLSVLDPDYVFYHVWGYGFYLYSDYGRNLIAQMGPDDGYCFDNVITSDDGKGFTVTAGTTTAPDQSGFITATASAGKIGGYDLVYVTKDGEVSCAKHVGSRPFPGTMTAALDEKTGNWLVMVSSRQAASIEGDNGALDVFEIIDPSKNGGRLELARSPKTITSEIKEPPVDLAYDAKKQYLWMVTKNQLEYWDIEKDTIEQPHVIKGFANAEFSSIEFDVLGNIWVGTADQGVYRLTRKGLTQDTLSAIHFSAREGLFSNSVHDIAIDSVRGVAWFSHERGVTSYKRNDLRSPNSIMKDSAEYKVYAYPNPFRPTIHPYVTIDNVGMDAVVSIFNRAGHLVRSFYGKEVAGGCVEWDGKNKSGNLVAPGVYWYVAKTGSSKKKGKILIIY